MTDPLDTRLRQLAQEIGDNTPPPHSWDRLTSPQASPRIAPIRPRRRLALTAATTAVALVGVIVTVLAVRGSNPRHPISGTPTTQLEQDAPDTSLASTTTPPPTHSDPTSSSTTMTTTAPQQTGGAPRFAVQGSADAEAIGVPAGTYCVPSRCVDGVFDPATFQHFPASNYLTVTTPMQWPLTASFRRQGEACAPAQQVVPTEMSPGVFRIDPAGDAGTYEVTLFAQSATRSRTGGDAVATIVWTTSESGPMAVPTARVAVLANHDGIVDSYGVELSIANMATQPISATATIEVISSEGASATLTPTLSGTGPTECPFGAVGSLYFKLDAAAGEEAAATGTAPYTYNVTLMLDDATYHATAVWPTEEMPDNAPNVALTFEPPLPAPTSAATGDAAVWSLDSSQPVSPDSRSFTALVTRLGCNGGVTGEVYPPVVTVNDAAVIVTFTVKATPGGTCPSNDQVSFVVDVGVPIGTRLLIDGACLDGEAKSTSFCVYGSVRR